MLHLTWIDWLLLISIPIVALILGRRRPTPKNWIDYFLARRSISSAFTVLTYIRS